MIKGVRIRQVHTDSLSCEPILRRTENGELLCVCQCDGTCDLRPDNRTYVFHFILRRFLRKRSHYVYG